MNDRSTLQRSAMSRVLLKASGTSANSLTHLRRRTQIIRIIRHAHAVRVVERGVGLNGEQNILQTRIGLIDVMHVVRGDILRLVACAQLKQFFIQVCDLFDVVLLQFNKETVLAKDIVIPVPCVLTASSGFSFSNARGISADIQPEVQINPSE